MFTDIKERLLGTPIETKIFRLYPQYTSNWVAGLEDYFLFRSPIPEAKRTTPVAIRLESKPLLSHSITKYAEKATTDTNQINFKYFIKLKFKKWEEH